MDSGNDSPLGLADTPLIVCFHAGIGYGHTKGSQAIAEAIKFLNTGVRVEVLDCLDFSSSIRAWLTKNLYLFTVKNFPRLWERLYSSKGRFHRLSLCFSRFLMVRSLRKRLGRFLGDNPIASVICTHFFAPAALVKLREKKGFDFKIFVAITDYDAHPFWSMPGVDGYFVANDTAKKRLMKVDVPRELVKVNGVPIEMKYMRWRPRDLARRKLGLSRRREGVLVVGGGDGLGPIYKLVEGLDRRLKDALILVVCGKNERLRRRLEDYTPVGDNEIKLYGFVDYMDMMYDACDLVVTKPGGVTSAELLAKGVPVVSMEIFGGQERRNLEYLHHSGGLFEVGDVEEGVERVAELLPRKKYLAKLKRRMRRFARPDSSLLIAGQVLSALGLPPTPKKLTPKEEPRKTSGS